MPIYEYECAKCGDKFEVIQKMSDKPLKKHGGCGGALTKLISAAGFQFKGTGWYVTDYARKGAASTETNTDSKDSKDSKDSSSNGKKDGSTSKPATEKAGTTGGGSGSGAKKD